MDTVVGLKKSLPRIVLGKKSNVGGVVLGLKRTAVSTGRVVQDGFNTHIRSPLEK
jgi:hypothetical protein